MRLIGNGSIKIFHLFRSSEFHHLDIEPLKVVNQKLFTGAVQEFHDGIKIALAAVVLLPCIGICTAEMENMVIDGLFVLFESLMRERESHGFIVVAQGSNFHIPRRDIGYFLVCIHIVGLISDRQQQFRNILRIHFLQLFIRDVRQVRVFLVIFPN